MNTKFTEAELSALYQTFNGHIYNTDTDVENFCENCLSGIEYDANVRENLGHGLQTDWPEYTNKIKALTNDQIVELINHIKAFWNKD